MVSREHVRMHGYVHRTIRLPRIRLSCRHLSPLYLIAAALTLRVLFKGTRRANGSELTLQLRHGSQLRERIAIVQYFGSGDELTAGFESARCILRLYAQSHGYALYTLYAHNVSVEPGVSLELNAFQHHSHNWKKPFYLSQLIREGKHQWYVYVDTDVVITDPLLPLEHWIDAGTNNESDLIISDDPGGICNGIIFEKASEWTLRFNDLWWSERQISRTGHDNWPFMAALLKVWANSSDFNYSGECSMSQHRDMEIWSNFLPCYMKILDRVGRRTTHPQGCTPDYPEPCGSAKTNDPRVVAVWDLNKGIGFGGKNAWTNGSFLIHFAGRQRSERDELMLRYSRDTMETYFRNSECR